MKEVEPDNDELFKKAYNLKKNELFKFYIEFNKNCNNNDEECKGIEIPDSLKTNNYLSKLYLKYIRNIKNIKTENFSKFKSINQGNNIEQRCIYLKYWIYDIISNNVTEDKYISTFLDSCNSEKNLIFSDNNCPCEFYNMNLNDIKYMRKLYAYYMLFDIYKKNNISGDFDKNGIYCYYLNKFMDIYEKKKESCIADVNNNCCKEFNKYIKENVNDTTLSSINNYCKGDKINKLFNAKSENLNQSDYRKASEKVYFNF
ncbi:Plasmodium vivax Vir protein, putative [Plasmodium vivax]|uniref:Variable surface protein Vir21 n=2 Tax=Plasmodium vivax TaxID=5855 RepID=A0A0J9TB52_PLAVI|nr:hypothetical protein PVMG_00730 [Plasmodium vivax Mauritania I]SCO74564.1 Plasmodium vivax Vir protein, putative [Plasmodium vivax]